MEEVLVGLIDTKVLDRRELQRLADKIAKAKAADAEVRSEPKGGGKS